MQSFTSFSTSMSTFFTSVCLILSWITYLIASSFIFFSMNRNQAFRVFFYDLMNESFPNVFLSLLFVIATRFVFIIVASTLPFNLVPNMFYSFVFFYALTLWAAIMGPGLVRDFNGQVAHLLPYGAPTALMLFLPLVEIFSLLIRPLTLMIRFATNISAGHIMMYMFSYFAMCSAALAPFLTVVMTLLLVMEICIGFLQCYIFLTLLGLYLAETI